MLTLLINATIGFIAAGVFASLLHSARLFLPMWQALRADLDACETAITYGVSVRVSEISAAPAPVHYADLWGQPVRRQSACLRPRSAEHAAV
jgi:hypothetical protein